MSWISPILACLPPWWRFLQCIRRFKDSDEKVHLLNAAKYTSGILATFAGGAWSHYLWVILAIINSCYTTTWDLKMDWGLLRLNSRHALLRDELVFHRLTYYLAMITNIILRFSWLVTLVDTPVHGDIVAFIIAFFEALRRIQWNTFRLENEHLNNCGQYRAIKEIPLPFAMFEDDDDDEATMNQSQESRRSSQHRPNSSVIHNDDSDHDLIEQGYPIVTNNNNNNNNNINSHNNMNINQPIMNNYLPPSSPIPMSNTSKSLSKRHSYHDGSFYGRRDFENKHDREETEYVTSASYHDPPRRYFSTHSTPLDHVLTRIRSLSGNYTDVSDTEHEDDLDSDDEA
ncbi:EXS family-domain-containing protein [Cunninghamella echinulata]|nr:EXS family-domain-containing protein [Cunninghamella echinulata]